jgi:hypothetical protein
MPVVGAFLEELLKIRKRIKFRTPVSAEVSQEKVLRRLLHMSSHTAVGRAYDFEGLLREKELVKNYRYRVPVFDYNKLYNAWWHRTVNGERDVTWPGRVKYFALTSGTSESASKRVPVTTQMLAAIRRTSLRQMLTIPDLEMPTEFYQKGILLLGGSSSLKHNQFGYGWEGDLSGIVQKRLPVWVHRFYKPGRKIGSMPDWSQKLDAITKVAHKWDVGIVCGVPAWIQLLTQKIMEFHKVDHIHEIWPNFNIYVHGGVSFTPYRDSFGKLLGKKVHFLDTYLASEGFIAVQNVHNKMGMQLVVDNGIFFEFIPFTDRNFDADGQIKDNPEVLSLNEVEKDKDYALLLSTCSGAWRYLIGDTIRFKTLDDYQLIISGRTKHFLSLVGEHLSVDNMNMAIAEVSSKLNVHINEFAVAGIPYEGFFAHKWYIGTNDLINTELLRTMIDQTICSLNDDYATERKHALKNILVETVPLEKFYSFMKSKGKFGGQHKFPRVLKSSQLQDWEQFLAAEKI